MKKQIAVIAIAIGAVLPGGIALHAEQSPPADAVATATDAAAAAADKAKLDQDQGNWTAAQKEFDYARAQMTDAKRAVQLAQEDANDQVSQSLMNLKQQLGDSMTFFGRAQGSAGRSLVIRSSADGGDGDQSAQLEEDLTVMAHILDKAVDADGDGGSRGRRAMGIDLVFGPASAPVRNLYIEGYGVVFLLNAGIPLVAPPARVEQPKENSATDSSWDAARREVYGNPGAGKAPPPPAPEYDSTKVENLKTSLLNALKSASNIRNLRSEDYVTVCVFGAGGGGAPTGGATAFAFSSGDVGGGAGGWQYPRAGTRTGGTMTIRVRKSDVDAFAKGKLTPEEFQRKAALMTYSGALGGASGRVAGNRPVRY